MKFLLAIVFGCVLLLGISRTMNVESTATAAPAVLEQASPAAADPAVQTVDEEGVVTDGEAYECRYSPYCQRASQCTAYCAGGIPVCFQGCCSCAS